MSNRNMVRTGHTSRSHSVPSNSRMLSRRGPYASRPSQRWIIWCATIGMFLPDTVGETGKYVIALFFIPAFIVFITALAQGKRKAMACDIFVWAAGFWMIAVKTGDSGSSSGTLFSAASDALGFVGSYTFGRCFVYNEPATREFIKALKFSAIALIALAALDTLSGTFLTKELMMKVFRDPTPYRLTNAQIHRSLFGVTILRAAATFGHPILYGTFCSLAGPLFLISERGLWQRVFYCAVCFIGCALSLSSAPILAFALGISIFIYNQFLHPYPQRWKLLWVAVMIFLCLLFVFSNNPVTFIFRHLTLDPATGYFRLLIWSHAADYIALSPITGENISGWATDDILSDSIDSVWLVLSLLYGLPMVALLLLANLSACGLFGRRINQQLISDYILETRTAFSLVLFLFAILGLSVHFWGSIWMLWGLCIGIRSSLEEYCLASTRSCVNTRKNVDFIKV